MSMIKELKNKMRKFNHAKQMRTLPYFPSNNSLRTSSNCLELFNFIVAFDSKTLNSFLLLLTNRQEMSSKHRQLNAKMGWEWEWKCHDFKCGTFWFVNKSNEFLWIHKKWATLGSSKIKMLILFFYVPSVVISVASINFGSAI